MTKNWREAVSERVAWLRRAPRLRLALVIAWTLDWLVRLLTFFQRGRPWSVDSVEQRGRELHKKSWCQTNGLRQDTKSDMQPVLPLSGTDLEAAQFHRVGLGHFLKELPNSDFSFVGKFLPLPRIMQKKLCIDAIRSNKSCVRDYKLPPIIWIVSLPRTGSTWLHQLCNKDPQIRTLKAWEIKYPTECTPDCGPSKEERQEFTRKAMAKLYNIVPRFKKIHHVEYNDPDECVGAFVDGWSPEHWLWGMLDMPQTRAAYLNESMNAQYENYKHILQAVLADDATQERVRYSRLVLKSPHHIVKLDEIAQVFPGSKILWIHRDMAKVVGSCCSMNQAVLDTLCPWYVDPHVLGRRTLRALSQANAKGLADRERLEACGALQFADIMYDELKRDPCETLRNAMRKLNVDLHEQTLEAIRKEYQTIEQAEPGLLSPLQETSSGAHSYELEAFGLCPEQVYNSF